MINGRGCLVLLAVFGIFFTGVVIAAWLIPYDVSGEGAKKENYPW